MARISTCALRIASVTHQTNARLAIAAAIFVGAGVLILFIINLLWAQRILRSMHPTIGWHRGLSIAFRAIYVIIFFTFVGTIITVVQSFYTLRPRTLFIDRAYQLYGSTFLAVVATLPILLVLVSLAMPRRNPPEKFGVGSLNVKIAILLTGSTLIALGAWYRCGTNYMAPVPRTQSLPDYFAKPCFYIFNFGVEILTSYLYFISRVDLRFHVPDGAKEPGSYEGRNNMEVDNDGHGDAMSLGSLQGLKEPLAEDA